MRVVKGSRNLSNGFQPPVNGVFVNRSLVGHNGNLKGLGSRFVVGGALAPYLFDDEQLSAA